MQLQRVYQTLAENIRDGLCTLILGPELSVDKNGINYRTFFKELQLNDPGRITNYFPSENIFAFEDNSAERDTRRSILDFYDSVGDQPLLQMISRIPFSLILNVCPDQAINKVYKQNLYDFEGGFFSKASIPLFSALPYPSKEKPIIFNVFGSVQNEQSLITTHGKLYSTIEALLNQNSLPEKIELYLNNCNSFILLGFDFDSWYYQLICHKLKVRMPDMGRITLSSRSHGHTNMMSVVMHKHFDIQFTQENSSQVIESIITKLEEIAPTDVRIQQSNDKYSIYISYARADNDLSEINRETFVNIIEQEIKARATQHGTLQLIRDKNELTYGDSIDSFMTRIGTGKTVILVISDKYLKSKYCMDEAMRVFQHKDPDQRVFAVVLDDAKIGDEDNTYYKEYWREKSLKIFDRPAETLQNEYYDIYPKVYRFLDEFVPSIRRDVNFRFNQSDLAIVDGAVNISDNKKNDFEQFINTVINKIKQ